MNRKVEYPVAINKVLAYVNPEEALKSDPLRHGVLNRAIRLVRAHNCELELFYVCHDPGLEQSLMTARVEINQAMQDVADTIATKMSELALRLKDEGVEAQHEVRWDAPEAEAIERKIADSDSDMLVKQSRGPSFVLGLAQTTDWVLIRHAGCHVWFVKGDAEELDSALTAIGTAPITNDILGDSDHALFAASQAIMNRLGVRNSPVHCYPLPQLSEVGIHASSAAAASNAADLTQACEQIADAHRQAVEKFAQQFHLDPDDVLISQGQPAEALPAIARNQAASVIVLGARELNRWERFINSVTAEPVLSDAPCDVLFLREPDAEEVPSRRQEISTGEPEVDLEQAIINPEKVFDKPMDVARSDALSARVRARILQAWELDIEAELTAENEGVPIRPTRARMLEEISRAQRALEERPAR